MPSTERSETDNFSPEPFRIGIPRVGFHGPGSAHLLADCLELPPDSVEIIGKGNLVMCLLRMVHGASATNRFAERAYDSIYPLRSERSFFNRWAQKGFLNKASAEAWRLIACHPSTANLIYRAHPELLVGVQLSTVCLHQNAEYPQEVKYLAWYERIRKELLERRVPSENICLTSQLLPIKLAENLELLRQKRIEKARKVGDGRPLNILVWPNGGGALWNQDLLPFFVGLWERGLIGNKTNPVGVKVMMGVNRGQVERHPEWFDYPGVEALVAENYAGVYDLAVEALAEADAVVSRPHLGAQLAFEAGIPLWVYGRPGSWGQGLRGRIERETAALLQKKGVPFLALREMSSLLFDSTISGAWTLVYKRLQATEPLDQTRAMAAISQARDFLANS